MVETVFGFQITRDDNEARAVIPSDMSTGGIVGTAPLADAEAFPIGIAVLVRTSDAALLAKLGATGTIPDALRGIGDQLGDFRSAAEVLVVRAEEGATPALTMANLIGTPANMDGIYALLNAGSDTSKVPRLVSVPGFTHQIVSGVKKGALVGGTGGTNGTFNLAFTGGVGAGAAGTFTVVGGIVTDATITNQGNYTTAPTASFAASTGLTGATLALTLEQYGNPVIAALPPVLNQLFAHAVVEGPGTNEIAIKQWRETFTSERLIPVDTWVKVQDGASIVTRPGAPRVVGLIMQADFEHGGAPMHSAANRPIQGIVGLLRAPSFSLTDGATEAQSLLAANIGIAVRGELGLETAVANSGFNFIGTDNASNDPLWMFYNVTRGRDYIHLGLMRTIRGFLGRNNIDNHVIQAVLNTATGWLTELQSDNNILGFRVGFDADQNTPENLRLGRFGFFFEAEEPPVLRRVDIKSKRMRSALEGLVQDLMANAQPNNQIAA